MDKDHIDYPASFTGLNYSPANIVSGETSETNTNSNLQQQQQQMMSFADVMQFADFGPKLLSNGASKNVMIDGAGAGGGGHINSNNVDPVYFLKFPVLNDKFDDEEIIEEDEEFGDELLEGDKKKGVVATEIKTAKNNKRKRGRSMKTSEEVESQRMTHIAVERNRRKQMNEHLRVLRSLMPGSYVQRGDQASIIGGAIEFVRELEQLLQCLESQKRRRLYGDDIPRPIMPNGGDPNINPTTTSQQAQPILPMFTYPDDNVEFDTSLVPREETAEKNSSLADVEVKLLGYDGIIKILCRRRQGQLVKIIAALEDFKLQILHTNITTVEQTVLYSFNVKVANESGFGAEDIANSVQQIFAFIHSSSI